MTSWLIALFCAAAGGVEGRLLAARRARAAMALLRVGLVAAALTGAALSGHLLAGAAGWAAGFLAGCVYTYRRL